MPCSVLAPVLYPAEFELLNPRIGIATDVMAHNRHKAELNAANDLLCGQNWSQPS
ncbi:MAG: hypothetical protein RM022_012700 [Nostoc sp. EfeVER01]|nr:hypothetical protein [Nostoc sp. EfeVER01]MDZ7946268.1 hypothetical protein [Nostoc sp. EfeVER01]